MKSKNKLKLKLFFENLPIYIIVLLSIFICSYVNNKYIESVVLVFCFLNLRYKFEKTYHSNSIWICLFITLSVIWIFMPQVLPIGISFLSSIFIAFIISFLAWASQCWIDTITENKIIKKENEFLKEENSPNINDMNNEEFQQYCKHKGLNDMETSIADKCLRVGLKGQEFYDKIGYSQAQAKRIRKKILEKLKK